jgi:hypothetical protein
MMLGSSSFIASTSGTKTLMPLCSSETRYLRSLSMAICMRSPLLLHSVLMINEIGRFINCPCTKGSAKASMAQAA